MPEVPRVQRQVLPEPAPQVFQSPDVPEAAFDGGIGRVLERTGGDLAQLGDRLAQEAVRQTIEDEERMAKQLDVEFSKRKRDILFGENGFFGLRGQNALDAYGGTIKAIDEARKELLASTNRQNVKDMFAASSAITQEQSFTDMDKFMIRTREEANDAASESRKLLAIEEATRDPSKIDYALGVIFAEVQDEVDRKGLDPNTGMQKLVAGRSAVVASSIKAAINHDDIVTAQRLYWAHGPAMDGITRAEIAKTLREASVLKFSQVLADEATRLYPNDPAARRQYVKDVSEGKIQDQTLELLRQDLSDARGDESYQRSTFLFYQGQEDRLRSHARQDIEWARSDLTFEQGQDDRDYRLSRRDIEEAWTDESRANARTNFEYSQRQRERTDALNAAEADLLNHLLVDKRSLDEWIKENPEHWAVLSTDIGRTREAQNAEAMVAEGREYASLSDPDLFGNLRTMSDQELIGTNLARYRASLTQSDWKTVLGWQNAAKDRFESTGANQAIYNAAESVLQDFAPTGFKWTTPSKNQALQKQALIREMTAYVHQFTSEGKSPTRQELVREAQRLWTPIKADTSWWPFTQYRGIIAELRQMTPEERAVSRVSVDDLTPDMIALIQEGIKQAGKDPDDEKLIEQLAAARLTNDVERIKNLLGLE